MRQATLCFLVRGDKVLLAMKKRGFGAGKWNGVGGKVGLEESIEQTAIRETKEEIEVVIKSLKRVAVLDFRFKDKPEWNQIVTVFLVRQWEGNPSESEEMAPQWFDKSQLPFTDMWPDDPYWLPLVLVGKHIKATFTFKGDQEIESFQVNAEN